MGQGKNTMWEFVLCAALVVAMVCMVFFSF